MAEEQDYDSSFGQDTSDRSESYFNAIIRDVVDESLEGMPDSRYEFWKPVAVMTEAKEGKCSTGMGVTRSVSDDDDLNIDNKDNQPVFTKNNWKPVCNLGFDNNCSCFEDSTSELRRSKSEDIITPLKCHRGGRRDHVENSLAFPMPSRRHPSQSESDSSTDDDDDDDDDEKVGLKSGKFESFFDEYEKKIDSLEFCDYTLEESILHLQTKVTEIEDLFDAINSEQKRENIDKPGSQTQELNDRQSENNTDEKNDEKVDENKPNEDEIQKTIDEIQKTFIVGLKSALKEMQSKFENFVTEVGETVQLGALAAKHSQKVEIWANHIQHLYAVVKGDQQKIQKYLEEKEGEWIRIKQQIRSGFKGVNDDMDDILEHLKNVDKVNEKEQVPPKKESTDDSSLKLTLAEMLQRKIHDEQQVIALDLNRQMKISELKLVVLRQQSYIQSLELQNKELDGILRGVLCHAETEKQDEVPPYVLSESMPVADDINTVSEVLNCDKGMFLPGKTTHPEFVALQTFDIGEGSQLLPNGDNEIFDPRKLNYIQHDISVKSKKTEKDGERVEIEGYSNLPKENGNSHGDIELPESTIQNDNEVIESKECIKDDVAVNSKDMSAGEPVSYINKNTHSCNTDSNADIDHTYAADEQDVVINLSLV